MYLSPTKNKTDYKTQQKKRIQTQKNLQKFESQWHLVSYGSDLSNYQIRIITQEVARILITHKDLLTACKEISKILINQLGSEHWNVILVASDYSRKTFASGENYAIFEKLNKSMTAIIWLNRLNKDWKSQKSVVRESEYF